jgi:O-antigen/teichoic acid export membrane protein
VSDRKRGLTRHAVTGLFWTAWGKGARAILQLLVLGVMARLLSPADFGVVNTALVVVGFSQIFSQIGMGPALVQRPNLEPRHIQTAFVSSVLLGLILGALIWLAAPVGAAFFRMDRLEPVLKTLAWLFPIRGLASVAESLMQRDMRFRWLANREVVSYAVGYGLVGIGLALLGWGIWALVAAQMGYAIVNAVLLLIGRPPTFRVRPERQAFSELLYFSGGFTAARTAMYLAHQGDNLVVGRELGSAALGVYGRAYQLMAMPAALFGDLLDTVLFPAMARVQGELQRLEKGYRRGLSLTALVMLPMSVVLYILAPELIHVVLGPRWTAVIVPFQIFAVGQLFRTSYKLSDSMARATGSVYRRAWRQLLYACLVMGGAWIGQHWGVEGACLGVLIAVTINFLLMAQLSLSVSSMSWRSFLSAHGPALKLSAAVGVIAWTSATVLRQSALPPVARLIVAGGVTLVCSFLLIWRLPLVFLGSDGLWMAEMLGTYLPKRFRPTRVSVGGAAAGGTAAGDVAAP